MAEFQSAAQPTEQERNPGQNPGRSKRNFVENTGAFAIGFVLELGRLLIFGVSAFVALYPRRYRFAKLLRAVYEIGVRTTPLVLIVGLFAGMVLGLQGYYTLVRLGSEGLLGPAVAMTLIRELGPVLTALMVVGQAGSSIAAELGIQRNSEHIDALETMKINPLGYLVAPRLYAAILCFPILTTFFDLIGIFGGYVTGVVLLHVDGGVYWSKLVDAVAMKDITGGYVKAVTFGLLTMLICTYLGFHTDRLSRERGARGVSQSTTRAVVLSSVVILISDYIITSFYI